MWAASADASRPRAPGHLSVYWQLARRGFNRATTYRGATVAGLFTNTVFGFLRVYVLLAVLQSRPGVGGFDNTDAITFTFLTQGLLALCFVINDEWIGERIRSGDIVSDLYRPLDFQGYWMATDLGKAGFLVLFRGIPPLAFASLFFDVRLPSTAGHWIAFTVSIGLTAVIAFAVRFCASMSGFWLLDARGVWQITSLTSMFLAGFVVPITFMPDAVARILPWLPFAAMAQLPAELFLGKHHGVGVASVLLRECAWAIALIMLGRLITRRAEHRVVVQGG